MNKRLTLLLTAALCGSALAQTPVTQTQTPATQPPLASQDAAALIAAARELVSRARATYPAGSASIDQVLWKEAAARAEDAVRAAPGNLDALRLRAEIYTEVGFWKQAESAWASYFQVSPRTAGSPEARAAGTVQYNLGYAAYRRGQSAQASQFFQACLALDPGSVPCATWAARSALEGGNYAEAQARYAEALRLAPNDKTLTYFAQVARNAATYGPAATGAFSRAYAALEAGNRAQALAGFQEAARAAPNFAEAGREAGRLALELGDAQAALQAYQALAALPGATAADRYNLGLAQEGAQFGLRAVQTFRSAYSKYAAGDKAGAEAGFLQATGESPTYAKAWAWLGRVRYEAGNFPAAAEAYGRAVALDPNDKSSAYFLRLAQQGK